MMEMATGDRRRHQQYEGTNDEDVLALCDVIEDYKAEFASLSTELSATRKALQRSDEQAAATQTLVAELEDAIYCLDDEVALKNALLGRIVCLLDADSPAEDIVGGLHSVIAAYESGSAIDDVIVMQVGDDARAQLREAEARFGAELAAKEDEVVLADNRIAALTRANKDLRAECNGLVERLRAAEKEASARRLTDDDKDDEAKEEQPRASLRAATTYNSRLPLSTAARPPVADSSSVGDSGSGAGSGLGSGRGSPVREAPRPRGTVVLQAIRKARARSVAVAASEAEDNDEAALDELISPGRYGALPSHRGGGPATAIATRTTTTNVTTVKPPPLSFSHPKFKRDVPCTDADECAILPGDLRHSSRSFSAFGAATTLVGSPQRSPCGSRRVGGRDMRDMPPRWAVDGGVCERERERDGRRPSSSGTQGRTDEEDDDDDDDDR